MGAFECILIALLILFIVIYFLLVPLVYNEDSLCLQNIWCPWRSTLSGSSKTWTQQMCNCMQNIINQNKPSSQLGYADDDIIRGISSKYDFFDFMNQYINSKNDEPQHHSN
jgi:hypothetical protein